MKPNFFSYATNELSQDAFFCWLIEWSLEYNKKENQQLHIASLDFLKNIIPEEFNNEFTVESCKIQMQKKKTDFIVEINKSIIIHFEDKIKSNTNDHQLSKYKIALNTLYPNHRIYHIYLKTDLVWPNEKKIVLENDYRLIDLLTITSIIKNNKTSSDIYDNFILNIHERINEYKNYKSINPKKWNSDQWIGYLYDLSRKVKYCNFDRHYVGEDFWFVFSWQKIKHFKESYVSFEIVNKKCAIKAHVYNQSTSKIEVLNYVKNQLKSYFKGYKTKLYNRPGKSVLAIEFFDFLVIDNKVVNFIETKQKLLEIREIFDEAINNVG